MPLIDTRAGALFYASRGADGPALLCLHGAGGSHQHWGYQLRDLAGAAQVYALDLPGHGRSAPPGRTSIPAYAEAALALLDACGIERAVLAGHSMGGAIALQLALDHPARVGGLALVGAGARLRVARQILDGMARDFMATVRLVVDLSYAPAAPAELRERGFAAFAGCDPAVYHGDFVACDAFDARGRLAELRVPATIVCGAADQMTPPKMSVALSQAISGATLEQVAGAGHMAMIERPAVVSAALQALLARVAPLA